MEIEPETLERILWIGSALGFAVAILGLVGEVLGWWNDTGELLVTVGTIAGLILAGFSATAGSSRSQVRGLARAVDGGNDTLRRVEGRLGKLDTLDTIDRKLDRLDTIDGKLDKLDVVHVALDQQTGVMDRQLAVLEAIRDRV